MRKSKATFDNGVQIRQMKAFSRKTTEIPLLPVRFKSRINSNRSYLDFAVASEPRKAKEENTKCS
jgi:hypothetical protein